MARKPDCGSEPADWGCMERLGEVRYVKADEDAGARIVCMGARSREYLRWSRGKERTGAETLEILSPLDTGKHHAFHPPLPSYIPLYANQIIRKAEACRSERSLL